jgi:hypothetical protein
VLELLGKVLNWAAENQTPATSPHIAWKRGDFKELYGGRNLAAHLVIGQRQHTILWFILRATDSPRTFQQ